MVHGPPVKNHCCKVMIYYQLVGRWAKNPADEKKIYYDNDVFIFNDIIYALNIIKNILQEQKPPLKKWRRFVKIIQSVQCSPFYKIKISLLKMDNN